MWHRPCLTLFVVIISLILPLSLNARHNPMRPVVWPIVWPDVGPGLSRPACPYATVHLQRWVYLTMAAWKVCSAGVPTRACPRLKSHPLGESAGCPHPRLP